ncbi:MAG: hypothetical protein KatS3mg082_3215 [Nitrospiraceae bacterium]|nr:MAG: hypothetical protein KatS3mg082_3215 [Nitrospiraceae bacterium]
MRVCQVIDRFSGGGQERVAVELARILVGHVGVSAALATRSSGDYELLLRESQVVVFCGNRRHRYDLFGWARIGRWLRRMRFDVVHAHSSGSLMAAVLLKRLFRLRYAVVLHLQMLPAPGTAWRAQAIKMLRYARPAVSFSFTTNPALRALPCKLVRLRGRRRRGRV